VKKEHAALYKSVIGFALIVFSFWGCTNDPGKTGLGLLPVGDLVIVGKVIDKNVQTFIVTDEKLRTDESTYNLLGSFNDPFFGKTTADFACQYRLSGYPEFAKNHVDSLVLYLAYNQIYGDTLIPQKLKIYELDSDIPFDDKFYQDINLKGLSKSEVLAEKNYIPKFKLDSLSNKYGSTKKIPKDTVTQEISFKLSSTLVNKFVSADSLTNSDNDKFLHYFKGLYIEANDLDQRGTLMKILGSGLIMYYHTDKDTLTYTYKNNTNASRVSRFVHDYSTAKFAANLDKEQNQDSLIYVQTTGGIRTKILIPNLGIWAKLIPEMANNPDTTRLTINKAELIFQLDTIFSEPKKYAPAEQLVLAVIDSVGKTYLPSDHTFAPAYYGGTYNALDRTYRFNIAKHIEDVIASNKKNSKKHKNYGFYLETAYKNSTSRRVVLKGATSKPGIRLEITYAKIK
jgi:hypothetical protein